ncbi:MAG TPA: M20/M25/M40 family metallo-hydrolase [Magnetospirillaceae bacterium]|nr:M20/M25/M40 family metallo-hydrolase [Magnetospirillaceae bacterium]
MSRRSNLVATALLALPLAAFAAPDISSGPIDPKTMSDIVKTLASDDFQGRSPGTPGEAKTIDYLIGRFKALGVEPAGDQGGWTQAVPLLRTQVGPAPAISISGAGDKLDLQQFAQISLSTLQPVDQVEIAGAPMVFVGYGVKAPERGWDDFKGADLKGKVVVFLVNDPDFEAVQGDDSFGKFGGKAMTYYGRWTYKYEEAARQGAAAALIVHETAGAAYGWSTVIAPQGETYDAVRGPNDAKPVPVQGWIQHDAAVDLFRRAGLDFEALKASAKRADFKPVAIGQATLSAKLPVTHTIVESRNVLAKIKGTKRPDETVMFGAHWDAYGVGAPDATGATIRRGAIDDGMGVAAVLEAARAFATAKKKPDRTVVFALWTAEERGLIGSETYAAHPPVSMAKTAANLTFDVLQTAGPAHDLVLVGAGQDTLEQDLGRLAAKQKRTITPDSHPEKGLFYRADHFSFAKRGVPTLLMMSMAGGADLVQGGREAGNKWVDDYTANCYHKTCDAWSADWDLRGAAQDVDLIYELGRELAFSDRWPGWSAGSEFSAIRAKSDSERK